MVAAVKNAEQILGPNRDWHPTNDIQCRFLAEFFATGRTEIRRIPEIESIASYSSDKVNAFLRERGFTIQLDPWNPPDFGLASVLDLLIEWPQKGEVTSVRMDDGQEFPGVRLGEQVAQFFDVPEHPNPVACLETKSGDRVYMAMLDQAPDGFDLVAKAQALSNYKRPSNAFGGLIFPMVDLNQEVDITWLIGMHTVGDDGLPAAIFQALQQTKLKMNEVGARVQSAAAIHLAKSAPGAVKPDHIINRPFLIWFERDKLSRPLFVGYITAEDWRDPGDIARDGKQEVTMLIPIDELNRDFIVVDDQTTGRQALDAAESKTYIVIRFADGRYAVMEPSSLRNLLGVWKMLDVPLRDVPDQVFARKIIDVVQQDSKDPADLERVENLREGYLLLLLDDEVAGLLTPQKKRRKLEPPAPTGVEGVLVVEEKDAAQEPLPPTESESEKRWINAEIEDHDAAQPLHMGEVYTLAFDVDTELRDAAVGGAEFGYGFQADEQMVELTIQLSSDDFDIYTDPQKLRVPRTGKSKGKARFDIEPKHEGEGVINAVFLKDGNFVQLLALKLQVGRSGQASVLTAQTLGRPVDAAFAIQPRDLNLTILKVDKGFQIILSGPVAAMATVPITEDHLDQMIAQVRQELQDIVHLEVGSRKVYQAGIDISPEVNQVALSRLAKAGFRLYQRVFYGPAADAQVNLLGDKLRQMAQGETLKIQIFSQHFMLPWGILYMADEYDPDHTDPELFLGLKHIIEHIPLQQTMQVIDGQVQSDPNLTVSLNVNADIDQQMRVPLIANQLSDWQKISQSSGLQVVVRKTKDELTQALADASTPDQILYFYCHAVSKSLAEGGGPDASTIVLSGNGRLTLEDLNLLAPTKKALPGAPLVFINACESAELSPMFYDGFVPYFMAKGARGVIGTECETPALFAAEWAKRFFNHFLTGKSLGQAFLDLRREFYSQHNNLMGLLYALYCDGDTRVVPGLQIG